MHFGYFPSRIFFVFCGYLIQNIWNPDIFEFAILGGGPIFLYYLQTVNLDRKCLFGIFPNWLVDHVSWSFILYQYSK